jgi:hypothetical protein
VSLSGHAARPTFRGTMPRRPRDEELDSTPYEGNRPGPHTVEVLPELPVDGEPTSETQLMSDAELNPREVEGDRFDVGDDDLGMAPDLEEDPDAPDLQPDHVERFAEPGALEEDPEADDDDDDRLTARPRSRPPDDELVEPPEPGEVP